jgi:hypothetical protein
MSLAFSYLSNYIPVRKELKFRHEGNVGIVCNMHDYRINYLNETAMAIFQLIDGKRTIVEIFQCFLKNVDVDKEVLESDLIEIMRNFQWQKLITLKQKV